MNISVTVNDKIAKVKNAPRIVCGNSDYVIEFQFDSEWDQYEEKTAGFRFYPNGERRRYDVLFSGNTCKVPVLFDTEFVEVGVFAGDLQTTTPAIIPCDECILCGDPVHADPPQDIYNQLLERLNEIGGGGGAPTLITTSAPYYYNPAQQGIGMAEIVKEAENGSFD